MFHIRETFGEEKKAKTHISEDYQKCYSIILCKTLFRTVVQNLEILTRDRAESGY